MPRDKKKRNDLIDRLQYLAMRLVAMMLRCFPVEMNITTAGLIGDAMFAFDRKHRERAMGNLRRSFPDMPEPMLREMARESMRQLIVLFVEVVFTTHLVRIDTWRKYVELRDFRSTLELLLDERRGLIMLTGHYGNWEVLGFVLATLGFPTTSVARTLDNPYVNEYVMGVRQKRGQRIVDKSGMTREATGVLDRHGTLGFIADQNAGSKGIFVDFFGRKASTYKSIGLLAMQYKIPVVIGYARRLKQAFRFQVGAQDIIYPEDWQNQDDPLRYITQRYTTAIENIVREDPGQYLWVHRRWKTRPKGEVAEKYD
jgi:Kdo2-lipid IVA lauroyltransferase/acyltransferase